MSTPPRAKRVEHVREHHGDRVVDPYEWLRDKDDPEVIAHLEAENAWAEERTAHLEPLRSAIFEEIRSRTQETDLSVPAAYRGVVVLLPHLRGQAVPRPVPGPRRAGAGPPRAGGRDRRPRASRCSSTATWRRRGRSSSPSGPSRSTTPATRIAYAVDVEGDERFALRIKDIQTGEVLDDAVTDIGYGVVWSLDGRYVFYTRLDDSWRPFQVWRHEVGTPAEADVLVFQEDDARFWTGLGSSRDDRFVVIAQRVQADHRDPPARRRDPAGPAARRGAPPRGRGVRRRARRRPAADHPQRRQPRLRHRPGAAGGDRSGAVDPVRRVAAGGADRRRRGVRRARGRVVAARGAHRAAGPAARLLTGRLRARPRDHLRRAALLGGHGQQPRVRRDGAAGGVRVARDARAPSPTTTSRPASCTLLKRQPVLGGYDPAAYEQRREWATAPDGTQGADLAGLPPRDRAGRHRARSALRLRRLRDHLRPLLLRGPALPARPRLRLRDGPRPRRRRDGPPLVRRRQDGPQGQHVHRLHRLRRPPRRDRLGRAGPACRRRRFGRRTARSGPSSTWRPTGSARCTPRCRSSTR